MNSGTVNAGSAVSSPGPDPDVVTGDEPARRPLHTHLRTHELTLRVLSALVLAPLAIATAYAGGFVFIGFWTIAAIGILIEWEKIVGSAHAIRGAGELAVGAAGAVAAMGYLSPGAVFLALGVVAEWLVTRERRAWSAFGVAIAGAPLVACILLRADPDYGFLAMIVLFAVVWANDVFGYFVGRLVGGPKLWPRVSPKKTWAGAIGGAVGGVLAAVAVAWFSGMANLLAIAVLALLLSAVSQTGDLFESSVKRRFGVKDASHVIPGHGGIMDRLDGFVASALVAVIIGVVRGGLDAPARGFLVW
jgi:phosphatidate cytidylyltransferase